MKLSFILLYGLLFLQSDFSEPILTDEVNRIERIIPLHTNLELHTDSILLEFHPVKEAYVTLYEGERVVVAEYATDPADSTMVWVKVAHSHEKQGWLTEHALRENFIPTDSISQFIYYFSDRKPGYFMVVLSVFILLCLCRLILKKQIPFVYFNDIDSLYPLFLCLLVSLNAVLYQSVQIFDPELWQQYYYSPGLSPAAAPHPLIAGILSIFWLIIIITLATIDVVFKQLRSGSALIYLLGLFCACIFCHVLFIFTTRCFIGYILFAFLGGYLIYRVIREFRFSYRCGCCGGKMKKRGFCPLCGTMNQ